MFVTPKNGVNVPDVDRGGFLSPAGREVDATPYWNRLVQVGDVVLATPPVVVPPVGETISAGDLLFGRRNNTTLLFAPPAVGTGGVVGTYSTLAALQAAFPPAVNAGKTGLVGAAAPYTVYTSNGSSWVEGGGSVGVFATASALQAAFPAAANAGKAALVGTVAPYAIYDSNGVSWAVRGSG
ncbi:hypothetical protein RD110_18630 [Rhodoferax koreense]|uniref:Uncharacterized protein n=1 Tax=Rhodoferax koreensis TaxID=1842727 RepID=A0A1P8JZ47_9BURK|nr:DUF2635 domain-containing protein [Rhodoferax koreense]APW38971.1 hypothetical protein RD110_18630 [Rhodoferax koreense]